MSHTKQNLLSPGELDDLIALIESTLELCQKKFVDPRSGKGPSCLLSLRLHDDGSINGYYLPILNQWGWNEYDHIVYGDGCFSLPCSHEDTWHYLTGRREGSSERVLASKGNWKAVLGGIRVGQVFFVRDISEYQGLGLEKHIQGGSMHRGPAFVKSMMQRSWEQPRLDHAPDTCPFCMGDVNLPVVRGDFIVFDNRFKPHPWHKVVVPSEQLLRRFPSDNNTGLLHPQVLSGMLKLLPELWEQRKEPRRVQCGIHFGVLSGQTMAHPHLHARQ
ncbi:MAG: hypothetical protein Q7R88_01770 [bacterium]|nr:hypothetical protein [bacterium]